MKRIDYEARKQIEEGLREGKSITSLEKDLGYGGGTINLEVNKNGGRLLYSADKAEEQNKINSKKKNRTNLEKKFFVISNKKEILKKLSEDHSMLSIAREYQVSNKTLKKYIKEEENSFNLFNSEQSNKNDSKDEDLDLFIKKYISLKNQSTRIDKSKEFLIKIMNEIKEFLND